jgi:hypothetical protein
MGKHDESKRLYKEDDEMYKKPWLLWEWSSDNRKDWIRCVFAPAWVEDCEYRRICERKEAEAMEAQEPEKIESKGHKWAHLMMAVAEEAKVSETPWDIIQYLNDDGAWHDQTRIPGFYNNIEYRIKPRTININGYEVPEPLRSFKDVDCVFVVDVVSGDIEIWNCNFKALEDQLSNGVIQETSKGAEQYLKAILSFTKQKIDSE